MGSHTVRRLEARTHKQEACRKCETERTAIAEHTCMGENHPILWDEIEKRDRQNILRMKEAFPGEEL